MKNIFPLVLFSSVKAIIILAILMLPVVAISVILVTVCFICFGIRLNEEVIAAILNLLFSIIFVWSFLYYMIQWSKED